MQLAQRNAMRVCYGSSRCGMHSPLLSLHRWQAAAPVTAAAGQSCRGLPTHRSHTHILRPSLATNGLVVHCSKARLHSLLCTPTAASASSSFSTADAIPVRVEDGRLNAFPSTAGVYAVFSPDGKLQYIGLSRKIAASVAGHAAALPDMTHAVRYEEVQNATKEDLTAIWQEWVQAAVSESGDIPPGNEKGNATWSLRRAPPKPEIKLTPGKGVQDLTCSVEDLVDKIVKSNKVVAFIKGTRTQPQCGFSHKVLTILNEAGAPYEVVNVLDEQYNPGLRDAIKKYSEWPTIPQLYIKGEFVGGADILEEMHGKGELRDLLQV